MDGHGRARNAPQSPTRNWASLMQDMRLRLRDGQGSRALTGWSAEQSGPNQLSLRTAQPRTGWVIELRPNVLKFSSTADGATLTAKVAAPASRVPARLIDPQGAPVDWVGTNEVKSTYGGSETLNPSFLPRTNADVMYFSLGQIASPAFHALFDRPSDIAIGFPDDAVMMRDSGDAKLLDLTLPVPETPRFALRPIISPRRSVCRTTSPSMTATSRPRRWSGPVGPATTRPFAKKTWCAMRTGWPPISSPTVFNTCSLTMATTRASRRQAGRPLLDRELEQDRRFPHGPEWLASYIKNKGLRPGIWLVPNSYANATRRIPTGTCATRTATSFRTTRRPRSTPPTPP